MTEVLRDTNYFLYPRLVLDGDTDGRADGVLAATKDDLSTPVAGSPVYTRILNPDGSYSQRIQYTFAATDSTQVYPVMLALTDVGSFAPGDPITGCIVIDAITLVGCANPCFLLWPKTANNGYAPFGGSYAAEVNISGAGPYEVSIASAAALTSRAQITVQVSGFSAGASVDITFHAPQIEKTAGATTPFNGSIGDYCDWAYTLDASASTRTRSVRVHEGDSLTAGDGSTAGHDYVSVCDPAGAEWTVYNHGAGSQTADQMVEQAAAQIDSHYYPGWANAIAVLWAGIVDIALGASASAIIGHIEEWCSGRQALGFKVVVCTITPCEGNSVASGKEAIRQAVNTSLRTNWQTYANALADIAADPRIGVKGDEDNTVYFDASKIHMTDTGYAIVADVVGAAITGILSPVSLDDILADLAILTSSAASADAKLNDVLLKTNTLGGAGAIAWPYTLTVNGMPCADAAVWVTSDEAGNNVVASGRTDDFGALVPVPNLDAGTYYFRAKKAGVNFEVDIEVVV